MTPPAATLILASRSPARAQLLTHAAVAFTVQVSPFSDPASPPAGAEPEAWALDMATRKALALANLTGPHDVILAADTVVVSPSGDLMGTPTTPEQATHMLRELAGARHAVISAAVVWERSEQRMTNIVDTASVVLGGLSEGMIRQHVEAGRHRGKAGGYNLVEVALAWEVRVEGDPATVVGLPMRRLVEQGLLCRFQENVEQPCAR